MGFSARWFAAAASVMIGATLAAKDALATSMARLSTDQLVAASELIVHGTVVEVWTERDDRGGIWTRAQVDVDEVYKGDTSLTAVVVDQRGGTYGGLLDQVDGAPRFSVGEETVLFLETLRNGHTVSVGMLQGKFNVTMDPYQKKKIVTRFATPFGSSYDGRFAPLPPAENRVTLDTLTAAIDDAVARGWDGQPIPGVHQERLIELNGETRGASTGVK